MSIEVLKQALDALLKIDGAMPFPVAKAAITALRQSIEQAELHTGHPSRHWDRTCPACNPEQAEKVEPVARINDEQVLEWCAPSFGGNRRPNTMLYTSPPTQAAKHWHKQYLDRCLTAQDDAARLGQNIVGLEAEIESLTEALESIALAGMSPSPEMSQNGIDSWQAQQAWRFIGIAARAIKEKSHDMP